MSGSAVTVYFTSALSSFDVTADLCTAAYSQHLQSHLPATCACAERTQTAHIYLKTTIITHLLPDRHTSCRGDEWQEVSSAL